MNDEVYMLTWTSEKVLVFNFDGKKLDKDPEVRDLPKPLKQGWGIVSRDVDRKVFISDGS